MADDDAFTVYLARVAFVDVLASHALRRTADMWLSTAWRYEPFDAIASHNAFVRAQRCEHLARMIERSIMLSLGVIELRLAAVASGNGTHA